MNAREVYDGSDGKVTQAFYDELARRGAAGVVALNLFRAQKCSERAKGYRRRANRSAAYDRKSWSIEQLERALMSAEAGCINIAWGWKADFGVVFDQQHSWVIYIDTPCGQISFHSPTRGKGPDYRGEWDGHKGMSAGRAIGLAQAVMDGVLDDVKRWASNQVEKCAVPESNELIQESLFQ